MKCEDHLCIYWREDNCTLSRISVDYTGHCSECIHVDFPEEELEQERKRLRTLYQSDR